MLSAASSARPRFIEVEAGEDAAGSGRFMFSLRCCGQRFKIDGRLAAVFLGIESISVFRYIARKRRLPDPVSTLAPKVRARRLRLTRSIWVTPCSSFERPRDMLLDDRRDYGGRRAEERLRRLILDRLLGEVGPVEAADRQAGSVETHAQATLELLLERALELVRYAPHPDGDAAAGPVVTRVLNSVGLVAGLPETMIE